MSVIQASLNPSSGEIKELPSKPASPAPAPAKPQEAPAPTQEPLPAAAQAAPATEPPKAPEGQNPRSAPDPMAKKFAALAQKDREIRQLSASIKTKEKEIAEREAQLKRFDELKHQNPIEAVAALGLSYDDLVKFQLAGGQITPEMQIQALREEIKKDRDAQAQKESDAQALAERQRDAQAQSVIKNYNQQVAEFVKSKPEEFELINLSGEEAIETLCQEVQNFFYETSKYDESGRMVKPGRVLTMEEAAKAMEEYLTQDFEKKRNAKKFTARVDADRGHVGGQPPQAPNRTPGVSAMERAASALSGPRPTLNNSMTASTPAPAIASRGIEDQRMARALAALSR